ncbi:MAG: hypothetical protein ABIE42_00455 [Candidatus Eisenbacteria bacterium]
MRSAGIEPHGIDPREVRELRGEDEALVIYRRVRDEIRAFTEMLPGALERLAQGGR